MLPLFLFMEASLRCNVFACYFGISLYWMFCICISQSCFNIFLCLYTYRTLIASHFFFLVYCFPGIAILPSSPHSCKALLSFVLFTLTLLSLTLLVIPPCPKVVVTTLAFTDNPKFLFFVIFTVRVCAVITRKWNLPPPHTGALRVLRPWDTAHCTSWISQYQVHTPSVSL